MGTLSSVNYSFTFVSSTLTVIKAVLMVTANDAVVFMERQIPSLRTRLPGL
jgi:hypothetical protein